MEKCERQIWVDGLNEAFPMERIEESPCTAACPLGTNVKSYVSLIAAGRFEDALEIVRRTNPFPGICGRVCPHPCEDQCLRGEIDEPIAIAALKRFLADYELRRGVIPRIRGIELQREKVAVIGAGPAGLTCALDLAKAGFRVTVFESQPEPGGMLAYGIPPYRLPRDILRTEIAAVLALGVDLRLNTPVGDRIGFEEIKSGFEAVFIATGAMKAKKMGIEGEEQVNKGLLNWISLLHEAAAGRARKPGDSVLVIGGGNTALDCARVALRLGSKHVRLVYRRSRQQMPAYAEELEDAKAEGVKFTFLASPLRLLHEGGRLTGVEFVRTRLTGKDESGRRRPVQMPGSRFMIPCDAIIPAVGQELHSLFLGESHLLIKRDEGLLLADPHTMATSVEGVFAGGDAVNGPGSVVEAITAGHRAAKSISSFLTSGVPFREIKKPASNAPLPGRGGRTGKQLFIPDAPPERMPRIRALRLDRIVARHTFDEIDRGLTELKAVEEASRCMRCGPCEECSSCVGVCEKKELLLVPSVRDWMSNESLGSLLPGSILPRSSVPANSVRANSIRQSSGKPIVGSKIIRVPLALHRKVTALGNVQATYGAARCTLSSFTVKINELLCRGCGLCEELCEYKAVQVVYRGDGVFTALVNEDMCRGCGTCRSVCPTGAIDQPSFEGKNISRLIEGLLKRKKKRGEDRLVTFACRWASQESLSGRKSGDLIQVMCIGSVLPGEVLKAFEKGASFVLLFGCREEGCHYGFGRVQAEKNMQPVRELLSLMGIDEHRLRILDGSTGSLKEVRASFFHTREKDEHPSQDERICLK